ncbi:GlxA family transcriptional regulator [Ketobacter sp.]|uniref:GlxA family transcriptional regulator n=1 Tax=Ketobacter sp. TaxID=2083498 RepID=UPI000F2CF1E2|nr:helix-turn-helix domain-containing protein [Ketobacter sp.]RLT95990.1 MAG: helix-turn-helix domain-containing protein [Ketobacter sp.]
MTGKMDTRTDGDQHSNDIRVAILTFPMGLLSCVFAMQESLMVANYCASQFGVRKKHFRAQLVGLDALGTQSFSGARVEQVNALPAPDQVDLVLVPAGPPPVIDGGSLQAWLQACRPMADWLQQVHAHGAQIASTCTGSLLLADAGLLQGVPATTHWAIEQVAQQAFPQVQWRVDESMVEHGAVITAGGGNIYTMLLQQLIQRHLGSDVAMETSRMLLLDTQGERQAVYFRGALDVRYEHPKMEMMKQYVAQHFRHALTLSDLAGATSLSERTLNRTCQRELGMTPMQFVQRVRIESVMHSLQLTPEPVNKIVWEAGYEDLSSFQRLFKRHTGLTMSEYRRRFGVKVYTHDEEESMAFEA